MNIFALDQSPELDVVEAYRNYYNGEKLVFAKWEYSQKPEWVK